MNDRDLTVSFSAVVCGVVMRIEDGVVGRSAVGVKSGCKWVKSEICSSDVPAVSSVTQRTKRLTWRRVDDQVVQVSPPDFR